MALIGFDTNSSIQISIFDSIRLDGIFDSYILNPALLRCPMRTRRQIGGNNATEDGGLTRRRKTLTVCLIGGTYLSGRTKVNDTAETIHYLEIDKDLILIIGVQISDVTGLKFSPEKPNTPLLGP